MIVKVIPCLSDNYSYIIHEKKTNTVSIVDPAEFEACNQVISKYKKLDFILNTHHHADHVGANLELKKKYNSKILGSISDKDRIPGIDISLIDNQKQKIGSLEFEVISSVAGVRPTVKDRKTLIGLHPKYDKIGVFNGLGTRGALQGPSLSTEFSTILVGSQKKSQNIDNQRFMRFFSAYN